MQPGKTFSVTGGLLQQRKLQTLTEEIIKLRLSFSFNNLNECKSKELETLSGKLQLEHVQYILHNIGM